MISEPILNSQPINWQFGLSRGLKGFWLAGIEGFSGGLTWYDLRRRNNGTLTGLTPSTAWLGGNGGIGSRSGGKGSLSFLGTGSSGRYVNCGTNPVFSAPSAMSMYCWIYLDYATGGANTGGWIFGKQSGFNEYRASIAQFASTIKLQIFSSGGSATLSVAGQESILRDAWNFVGWKWDGTTGYAVLNGKVVGSNGSMSLTINPATSNPLKIGGNDDGSAGGYDCIIDSAMWYNRCLTANEDMALYQESLKGFPRLLNRVLSPIGKAPAAASSVSATATLSIAGATISASATHTAPSFTAAVAAAISGATISASATHTAPTFSATVAAGIAGTIIAASATHTAPTYTASTALANGGSVIAASASFNTAVNSAAVAASIAGATITASATHTAPTFSATVAAGISGATISASATHTAPIFTAATALANGGSVIAASATFAPGTHTATAALSISGATIAATATPTNPTYTATVAMSCGAALISTIATFAEANVASIETFVGVRYFDTHVGTRYFETFVSAR